MAELRHLTPSADLPPELPSVFHKSKRFLLLLSTTILVVAAAATGGLAQSQPRTAVLSAVSCERCTIVAESIAYIGFSEDTVSLLASAPPARDSRGRIYAMGSGLQATAYLFDARGQLIKSFGRPGQGPGEFATIISQIRVGTGDSVFYFDRFRALVFSAEQLFGRHVNIPPPVVNRGASIVLPDGAVVRATSTHRFHLVPPGNNPPPPLTAAVRFQGGDTTDCGACGARTLAAARDGNTIWSAPGNSYKVEQHTLTGELLVRLERKAPWFPDWPQISTASTNPADMIRLISRARIFGIQQERDGLLWIYSYAPDPATPVPANLVVTSMSSEDQRQMFNTHFATFVDVIDPVRLQIVASSKFKGVTYPIGDGHAARDTEDAVGGGAFTIFRMTLQR